MPRASALYRLMAWLSPAYPVGAFSYSSGIEWAVESGDITDAASFRRWLDVVIASGSAFCDAVLFVHAHRAVKADDENALRDGRRARGGLRPLEGASSRNDRAGPRFHRGDARRMAMRGARSFRCGVGRAGRLSGRRRCHGCRPRRSRSSPRSPPACTPSPRTSSRRACASFRLGRPKGSVYWRRWSRGRCHRRPRARQPRSIRSAARRFAPTSPACATRRNTRGCSGRDPQFVIAGLDPAIPIRDAKP